jgi:hypothetical protein
MKLSRTALEQAIGLQRADIQRLQVVVEVDLPAAQKRLRKLEHLLDKLTPNEEQYVDAVIKEVV